MARLKISSSLENFKILNFFKIWALRVSLVDISDIFNFFLFGDGGKEGGVRGGGRGGAGFN